MALQQQQLVSDSRSSALLASAARSTKDAHSINNNPNQVQCFKTKRCQFFLEGRCTRGVQCTFAHTNEELRLPPNLMKTKLCAKWKRGRCSHVSSKCNYAHGVEELRALPVALVAEISDKAVSQPFGASTNNQKVQSPKNESFSLEISPERELPCEDHLSTPIPIYEEQPVLQSPEKLFGDDGPNPYVLLSNPSEKLSRLLVACADNVSSQRRDGMCASACISTKCLSSETESTGDAASRHLQSVCLKKWDRGFDAPRSCGTESTSVSTHGSDSETDFDISTTDAPSSAVQWSASKEMTSSELINRLWSRRHSDRLSYAVGRRSSIALSSVVEPIEEAVGVELDLGNEDSEGNIPSTEEQEELPAGDRIPFEVDCQPSQHLAACSFSSSASSASADMQQTFDVGFPKFGFVQTGYGYSGVFFADGLQQLYPWMATGVLDPTYFSSSVAADALLDDQFVLSAPAQCANNVFETLSVMKTLYTAEDLIRAMPVQYEE